MVNFRSAVFIVSLLALEEVTGMCIKNACARKRAMPFGDPAADVVKRAAPGGLEKRQGGYTWSLDSIPDWAALPYSTCGDVGGSGTTICPVNYYCAVSRYIYRDGSNTIILDTFIISNADEALLVSICWLQTLHAYQCPSRHCTSHLLRVRWRD